jgi:antitoxin StbD
MQSVLADLSVSITELKRNPSAVISGAGNEPVAILNNNRPTAYIIPAETYEAMLEIMEDHHLGQLAMERLAAEGSQAVDVNIDELQT